MEPFLEERIKHAESQAKRLIRGQDPTEENLVMYFRFALARRYMIGIFSDYFEGLTLDQLAYECYLWQEFDYHNNPEIQRKEALEQYRQAVAKQNEKGETMFGAEEWEPLDLDAAFLEQAKKDFEERTMPNAKD